MKKLLYITIVLLCSMPAIAATPYDMWWQKANGLYIQKQFDSAAYYYEKIVVSEPGNAEIYYNLGNAYYRLNRIGLAVLNYERALRIDPDYKDAKENLVLTQSRIANRVPDVEDIFFVSWWNSLTSPGKATAWTITCLIIFMFVLAILLLKKLNKISSVPPQLIGLLSLLWLVFLCFAFFSAQNTSDSHAAVVMQADAPLLNAAQGKTQSLVPEGTTVRLSEIKDNWVEVRLPDGRTGWMQQSLLTKI